MAYMWKWLFPYYQKTNVDDDLHLKMAVISNDLASLLCGIRGHPLSILINLSHDGKRGLARGSSDEGCFGRHEAIPMVGMHPWLIFLLKISSALRQTVRFAHVLKP
jgi:hypothetical protein